MRPYPIPFNEPARLDAVAALGAPDGRAQRALDVIVGSVRAMTGAESAMVSVVEAERQVFTARAGVSMSASRRELSLCAHMVAHEAPLVIEDTRADPVFAEHPVVTGAPFLRFYVGAPVRLSNRMVVGGLCAFSKAPGRAPAHAVLARLSDLADLVGYILEERAVQEGRGAAIAEATSRAQEDFLALANHEMRSPLRAGHALAAGPPPERLDRDIAEALRRSGTLLTRLVEGVLTHRELRSGSLVLREAVVPAARIAEAVRASVAPRLAAAGRPSPEVVVARGLRLRGDPALLALALDCVAQEALTRGRGVLRLRIAARGREASLAVEDDGPAASRAGAGREAAAPGLTLARRLIELHGGELALDGRGGRRGVLRLPRWRVIGPLASI